MRANILSKLFISLFLLEIVFSGCKKNPKVLPAANIPVAGATRMQLTLDSIFLYAKETYLWFDALPSYEQFNPRQYNTMSSELDNYKKELFDITQFKINPKTAKPFELLTSSSAKYSYITIEGAPGVKTSSVNLEGVGDDFGFALSSVSANDIRIRYVNPGSPAAVAGLMRGYRLVKINGTPVRADSQIDVDLINSAFNIQSMTLTVEKPDKTSLNANLVKGSYNSNPVVKSTVLTTGAKKAGYIVYARFSSLQNSQGALDNAFADFSAQGIEDIIIDLRYNGGGYVETAQYLNNLIAPSALNGSIMYIENFNQLMQTNKAPILSKQIIYDSNNKPVKTNGRNATYADVDYSIAGNTFKFSKKGSLNTIKNAYFIISGSTASASELVINSLKPYLNVKLIGEKSYGKPIGFFGIKIDKYTVYMSQFNTKNSAGEGDYFDGFQPDFLATDDVTRDFGDPSEISLAKALSLVRTGTAVAANKTMVLQGGIAVNAASVEVNNVTSDDNFYGLIEGRIKLK